MQLLLTSEQYNEIEKQASYFTIDPDSDDFDIEFTNLNGNN